MHNKKNKKTFPDTNTQTKTMTQMNKLKENYQYFLDNKQELASKYAGLYVVIVDCKVVGNYADEKDAYNESVDKYGLGNFIIQLCSENEEAYIQTYHSRVAFA